MKDHTKRVAKASAMTTAQVVVEAGFSAYHKTLGRLARTVAQTYWDNRGYVFGETVKACGDCKATYVEVGNEWKFRSSTGNTEAGVHKNYCDVHKAEAKLIITSFNRLVRRG